MAVIKQLFDNTINDKIYPVTHINAVLDDNGNNISDLLIGGGGGSFVVNFTFDEDERAFRADQTQSAIYDAYQSGQSVLGYASGGEEYVYGGQILYLECIRNGDCISFTTIDGPGSYKLYADWGDTYYYDSSTSLVTYSQLNQKANIASPSFTGTPTAPTAAASSNGTQIATTAFVKNALNNVHIDVDTVLDDASTNPVQNKVIASKITTIERVTAESLNDLEDRKIDESVANARYQVAGNYVTSAALAAKADLVDGKVPAAQLPSYVDDVIEGTMSNNVFTPTVSGTNVQETGKLYVDTTTNKVYRWSGSTYVEMSSTPSVDSTPTANSNNLVTSGGVRKAIDDTCPIIVDTRSSGVAAITGVAPFAILEDGQRILLKLNYSTANTTTLNLTLSDNTTTGAKGIWGGSPSVGALSQVSANRYKAGQYIELVWDNANNRWMCTDSYGNYPASMLQSDITNSTELNRLPTGKLLTDNFYTETEIDTMLAALEPDSALDLDSENPVQNKVVSQRISELDQVFSAALNNLQANQNLNKTQQVTGTAAASVTIDPYKFYDFGTLSQSMAIVFNTSAEISGYTREYTIRFVAGSGCNVTLPNGVLYANNTTPTYTTGRTYEINVVNNCVVVAEFY